MVDDIGDDGHFDECDYQHKRNGMSLSDNSDQKISQWTMVDHDLILKNKSDPL